VQFPEVNQRYTGKKPRMKFNHWQFLLKNFPIFQDFGENFSYRKKVFSNVATEEAKHSSEK